MTKYCEFQKDHDHHTIYYRALRAEVVELLKKGHLEEFYTDKGKETCRLATSPNSEGSFSKSRIHH